MAHLSRRDFLRLSAGALAAVGTASVLGHVYPEKATDNAVAHSGRPLVPESWRSQHQGPYTIRLAIAVDPEWKRLFGTDAEDEARSVVAYASRLLVPAGVRLEAVSFGAWDPAADATDIRDLYPQAESVPLGDTDVVVAFTAAYDGQEGGFTGADHRHVVLKHHMYRSDHDALVLTHEIGHDLGLEHHGDCPAGVCIMAAHAFDGRQEFCPEHLQLLTQNAGFFQYTAGT